MKILCDVCSVGEAAFYCTADEASLCAACDHRVHHANKLAGKHQRFSLLHPSPKQSPICDICQERKAFLFCQQDRAILCRECDISIHKTNQHTQKHTRFLLTGVKLSATSTLYSASSNLSDNDVVPKKKASVPACTTPPAKGTTPTAESDVEFSTSSISEYLMEMLPGWHVEDFLDASSPVSSSCKSGENDSVLPFWDGGFATENMGIWVPRVQVHQTQNQSFQSSIDINNYCNNVGFGIASGCRDEMKEFSTITIKSTRKRSDDNSFAVPQITPPSLVSKRSRNFR